MYKRVPKHYVFVNLFTEKVQIFILIKNIYFIYCANIYFYIFIRNIELLKLVIELYNINILDVILLIQFDKVYVLSDNDKFCDARDINDKLTQDKIM